MPRNTSFFAALASSLFALPVMAADTPASPYTITSNIGFVTDYVYRGITQTAHKPAIQGGIDYVHRSGFYAGVWGSNVSWISDSGAVASGSVTEELDTYFGYKGSIVENAGYDVGYVRCNFLGSYTPAAPFAKADTAEVYGAISYKFLSLKYSYGVLNQFLTVPDAKGTSYIDLSANYPVADSGITVGAHIGKQTFKGSFADAQAAAGTPITYTDYKLNVSKDFSGYVVGLAYTNTNASSFWTYSHGGKWGKGVAALSLTHSF